MKNIKFLKFRLFILFSTLTFSINNSFSQAINHWETAIYNSDTWKYLVPKSEPTSTWRLLTFDDSSWLSGIGGFGYKDDDDGTIIGTSADNISSVLMRIKFNVIDTSLISLGILHISYDDAFVAYINGIEIARSGLTDTYPAYNQLGTNHNASMLNGGMPEEFILNKKTLTSCLNQGVNVLTIQVHNSSLTSSDMSSNAFLSFAIKDKSTFFRSTPSWFSPPASLLSTYLPIISINTNGQTINNEPKITADMKIIYHGGTVINNYTDDPNIYDGKIGIEIRGATSSGYPQTPYGIETRDIIGNNLDTALLGMPSDNDWVLLSNWNEKSFARNVLSFEIFNKMGHYAPRVRHCEVMINDTYRGVYLFGEKIKIGKGRTSLAKLTNKDLSGDAVTGGYIFKTDYDDGVGSYWTSNYSPINRAGAKPKFVYHDPKAEDLALEQKTYIAGYVNALETALYSTNFADPTTGYRAYLDVNTFVDYFILEEVARNVDGYKKSRFFHKNKDSKNKLIDSGPVWDFDWAWKNLNDCELYKNTTGEGWAWNINYCYVNPVPPSWEAKMLQDPYFANAINTRYFSLRKNILSLTEINRCIDSIANLVNDAQVRHYKKYPILGTNNGAPEIDALSTTYAGEIQKLKNWIAVRLAWLDANMVGKNTAVNNVESIAKIRVFPNPVQEILYVESDIEIRDITIYNSLGFVSLNIKANNFEENINVKGLSTGIYVVKVTLANGITTNQKLIKE